MSRSINSALTSYSPNRQVHSGHYVAHLKPDPLPDPEYVVASRTLAASLGIKVSDPPSTAFLRTFSGWQGLGGAAATAWATPYAISIYGQVVTPDGAGPYSSGYGDGRAISIGELLYRGQRNELQLKGSGTTPFCRGADGRAVLRSSVREYLASEAMHFMGCSTTRALSLIASGSERVTRPWYSANTSTPVQFRGQGDRIIRERTAMVTRVSPSFIRVGQVELFGRRAMNAMTDTNEMHELELLAKHIIDREFPDGASDTSPLQPRVLAMLRNVSQRFANLAADWIRVGYTQSNFNSDNCLVAGRTIDYGPFGFIELFKPDWTMWIGGGSHFSFMNQPEATKVNFRMLVQALKPLLDQTGKNDADRIVEENAFLTWQAVNAMFARKLGFSDRTSTKTDSPLWKNLEMLLRDTEVDWTIFWRQLAAVVEGCTSLQCSHAAWSKLLDHAFYKPLTPGQITAWSKWISAWLTELDKSSDRASAANRMRWTSPKYVPREWMLVSAYTAAERGDYSIVRELARLFEHPFDEQPEFQERYYRRAPDGAEHQGGLGFMS